MNFQKAFDKYILAVILSLYGANILLAQQHEYNGYSLFYKTLSDLTWPEVKKAAEENAIVLLPIGVIEEHGPHMCLGTDTYLAYQRSAALKQKLDSMNINTVIAPPFYWGVMQLEETGAFPGSFIVSPSTMKALLADLFSNLQRWGFKYFYCVNHHGDRIHRRSLKESIDEAKEKLHVAFYNDREQDDRNNAPDDRQFISGKLFEPDFHAGASETSAMLEYYPNLVNSEILETLKPEDTFQPMGYAGDPANYKSINMPALDSVEVDYYAACIAAWLQDQGYNKK